MISKWFWETAGKWRKKSEPCFQQHNRLDLLGRDERERHKAILKQFLNSRLFHNYSIICKISKYLGAYHVDSERKLTTALTVHIIPRVGSLPAFPVNHSFAFIYALPFIYI